MMKGKIGSLLCRILGHRMRRDWVPSDSLRGAGRFEHRCQRCGTCLDGEYVSLYRPSTTLLKSRVPKNMASTNQRAAF
ncbi:MAG: hypothetical protein RL885_07975 [Planctomycetota bacterium]